MRSIPSARMAGTMAAGALVAAGCGQPPEPVATARAGQPFENEYGPRQALTLAKSANVLSAFAELGAPFATYPAGDKTVYRWGHGKLSVGADGQASLQRDELLITARADGTILDMSYKNKVSVSGLAQFVMDVPH